jgi:hypothetical protein
LAGAFCAHGSGGENAEKVLLVRIAASINTQNNYKALM